MIRIVVDAMGGDFAPSVIVEGAILATEEYDLCITLVGKKDEINSHLNRFKYDGGRIEIFDCSEVIEMHEPPAIAVRKKQNSSIVCGINLLKEKKVSAFVSAGNTGAVVCAASLYLGLLPKIERPGIAIIIPTLKGNSLICDVGANIDPKPIHLLQYGIMGQAYLRNILNINNPLAGLLSIGEEEIKGTEFVRETHRIIKESNLNFMGNIEGRDIFSGKCDIILCDGFAGNIALKVIESFAETINEFLKRQLKSNLLGRVGLFFLGKNLYQFRKGIDWSEYGGGLLLGINGIAIIAHGRSTARAIKNAIRVAREEVQNKVNEKIVEELERI